MKTRSGLRKGRLARRLIVAIVLFSTAITFITTAGQLYLDYDQDVEAVHSRISQIKESQLSSIVASVWFLDNKQVQLQLDGLRRMPDIEYLAIEVEGSVKWSSGAIKSSDNIIEHFPLTHTSFGREDTIGTLKIVASLDEVFRRLYSKVIVILIGNAFKTFLVAGFIYIIVRHMITRHLDRFALYTERFELGGEVPPLVLDRPPPSQGASDEFDILADALNKMRQNLSRSYDDLKDNEEYNRTLFEQSPIGQALCKMDRTYVDVNSAYAKIVGISPGELLGMNAKDITPDGYGVDDNEQLVLLERRGRFGPYDKEYIRKDGRTIPIRISGHLLDKGNETFIWVVAEDITQVMEAQTELNLSEERFKDFAESSSDWFWEIDKDYVFTYISSSFEARTGLSVSTCLGLERHKNQALKPIGGNWTEHLRVLDAREAFVDFPMMGTHQDGTTFYVHSSGVPVFDGEGSFMGYRGSGRDVTEIVKAEANREQLEAQLRQSQRLETVGTLAGGIAHDFNNLLMPILGYTEIMLSQLSSDDKMYGKLERIAKAAERAKTLVQQILTFSRRGEQSREPTDLSKLIQETLKLTRAAIPTSTKIYTNIREGCPNVMADATQMHQMLMNLYTNATQAMGKDGGVLSIEMGLVDAEMVNSPQIIHPHIKLKISDTGPGMDQDVLERIFEPFFSTKKQQGGTGLGLATVHGIVTSHNGKIDVVSRPGEGSSFEILLPVIEEVESQKADQKDVSVGQNEQIMFVDDEPENGDLAQAMLSDLGYTVDVFTDSLKALEFYGENRDKIDLIITDQTMPNLTGEELVKNIKTVNKDIPVIMITGFSAHIDEEKSKELGINKLLMKPVKMEKLASAIKEALG